MTKKVKSETVAEVPPKKKESFAEQVMSAKPEPEVNEEIFAEVPFLNKSKVEGRREFQSSPTHEPIVEIAGKTPELEDVPLSEIMKLGFLSVKHYKGDNNVLKSLRPRSNDTGNWSSRQPLSYEDIKFKRVKIDGINIYISSGSTLIITESIDDNEYGVWVGKRNTVQQIENNIFITGSKICTKYLTVFGNNTLLNSTVISNNSIRLIDAELDNSIVSGDRDGLTIDDSFISYSTLKANVSATIVDSNLNEMAVSGIETINLSRVSGGSNFSMYSYGLRNGDNVSLYIDNQYLHPIRLHNFKAPSSSNYTPLRNDHPNAPNTLFIERRIDYGYFSALGQIGFVRLNEFDILVDGETFSVKDFFPEFISDSEKPKAELNYPVAFPLGYGGYNMSGTYVRNTDLWSRAANVALGGKKQVVGRSGEALITSLLDQIKSRIGLYVELYSVR